MSPISQPTHASHDGRQLYSFLTWTMYPSSDRAQPAAVQNKYCCGSELVIDIWCTNIVRKEPKLHLLGKHYFNRTPCAFANLVKDEELGKMIRMRYFGPLKARNLADWSLKFRELLVGSSFILPNLRRELQKQEPFSSLGNIFKQTSVYHIRSVAHGR